MQLVCLNGHLSDSGLVDEPQRFPAASRPSFISDSTLISRLHEKTELDFSYPVCGSFISLRSFIDCFPQKNQPGRPVHQASQYQSS